MSLHGEEPLEMHQVPGKKGSMPTVSVFCGSVVLSGTITLVL